MSECVKLRIEAWLLEEEKEIEKCLNVLRFRLGTIRYDTDKTCNFLEGYLSAVRIAIRREDL